MGGNHQLVVGWLVFGWGIVKYGTVEEEYQLSSWYPTNNLWIHHSGFLTIIILVQDVVLPNPPFLLDTSLVNGRNLECLFQLVY